MEDLPLDIINLIHEFIPVVIIENQDYRYHIKCSGCKSIYIGSGDRKFMIFGENLRYKTCLRCRDRHRRRREFLKYVAVGYG